MATQLSTIEELGSRLVEPLNSLVGGRRYPWQLSKWSPSNHLTFEWEGPQHRVEGGTSKSNNLTRDSTSNKRNTYIV